MRKIVGLLVMVVILVTGIPSVKAEYLDRIEPIGVHNKDYFTFGRVNTYYSAYAGIRYNQPIFDYKNYVSEALVSRGQFAATWAKILELDPVGPEYGYKDTKGSIHSDAIDRLSKTHIIDYLVDDAGNYYPDKYITRSEMAIAVTEYWKYSGFMEIYLDSEKDWVAEHEGGVHLPGVGRVPVKADIDNYQHRSDYEVLKMLHQVDFSFILRPTWAGIKTVSNYDYFTYKLRDDMDKPATYSNFCYYLMLLTGRNMSVADFSSVPEGTVAKLNKNEEVILLSIFRQD